MLMSHRFNPVLNCLATAHGLNLLLDAPLNDGPFKLWQKHCQARIGSNPRPNRSPYDT